MDAISRGVSEYCFVQEVRTANAQTSTVYLWKILVSLEITQDWMYTEALYDVYDPFES